jgi:adenylate cyclase
VETESADADIPALAVRVRDAIARFDDIVTVRDPAAAQTARQSAGEARADTWMALRLMGAPAADGKIRISARLVSLADQAVIWSREFDPIPRGSAGDLERTRIMRSIAGTVAQPYGVIQAHIRNALAEGQRMSDPYGCTTAAFDYWRSNSATNHALVRGCLLSRINDNPNLGSLHAQLAFLHLEEQRHGYNPLPGDPLDRALESARRAVALAPTSARSHQALLAAHFSRREVDPAWRAAGEAMQLNPFDADITADVGARHIQSGHYEKGLSMLEQALDLNPNPPAWAATYRVAALYLLGRLDQTKVVTTTLQGTEYPPAMMALVILAARLQDVEAGRRTLEAFLRTHPAIAADLGTYLERLHIEPVTAKRLSDGFQQARRWVESAPR